MSRAVVFDLNGVFLQSDYLTDRLKGAYDIPVDESLPILKESMDSVRNPDAPAVDGFWEPLLKKYWLDVTEKEFLKFWFSGETLVTELIKYGSLLRRKRLKVFVLSNNFRERTTYYRKEFPQIFDSVDGAYFSWETGFVKPDPKAFINILNDNDLKPADVLYFDDSEKMCEWQRI